MPMAAGFICSSGETQFIQGVCAIVLKGQWSNLFNPKLGSSLSSITIHQVLLQLSLHGYGPSPSWAFFKWVESIPNSNYKHSLQCSWTMIHILTKHRHFRPAQQLLEKISQRDFLPSPSVLSALVTIHDDPDANSHVLSWLVIVYVNLKMIQEAIQVFNHMRLHRFKPHLPACTVLLNSLVKDRLTDLAWKLYKKMVRVGVVPNIHIYNVLIHACCNSGDVEKAEGLVSQMELKYIFPDLVTYNTLIALYCKRSMHYEALSVQHRMERAGVSPDIVTYNSLIYGFCREGRMREAVRLFREIKGATSNHITYTTLVDGYCRQNDLEESLRLLEVMKAKGLYPGVVAYNSILRMLCKEGRIRDANKLLVEMSERKVKPDNVTCNTLINAYCKIGDMRSAMKVKEKMLEAGLKLDQFTYKGLIHGFCKVQDMENAKELLFSMIDAGFSPSYCTYSWIVDGFCNQENEEYIIRLPDEFAKRGLCVDLSLYRALIRRLCKRERLDCAEKIFSSMQGKKVSGDCVVYTSLAYANMKAGKSSVVMVLLDDMYKRRLMITRKIYRSFNDSYASDNEIIRIFWDHMVERGLMSKGLLKEMQKY
ncbi:Tetratricopeptide-like helical domain containing protein [Parasponia andersonii]|uniref:Tetratricopeptide-like helical domain containing protein n=1 Tax=Parasponia andersonii TaxID=3476 RepID=A0A2P5CAE1_PARAD|nr:Tetratricopeptide-like helical domain containing protein [Parasponia andersonii]